MQIDGVAGEDMGLPGGSRNRGGRDADGRVQHPCHHIGDLIRFTAQGNGRALLIGHTSGKYRPGTAANLLEERGTTAASR